MNPLEQLELLYALIRRFEGCKLRAYLCPAGVWTCGWGSTGVDVGPGTVWTQEYADRRMKMDALRFARATLAMCPGLAANVPALCAIADFAYNLGERRLRDSTLRRVLNAAQVDWIRARAELKKWVNGGGRQLPGLVTRRAAECALLPQ